VQLDEPFLEARADKARAYGVEVINEALKGIEGTTTLHLCFGYAALVRNKPGQYSYFAELADTNVDQISIETAQPNLDCSILESLGTKSVMLGVLDLGTEEVESPETIVARVEKALEYTTPEQIILAPDCGMKFLPRASAKGKLTSMATSATILRERFEG
jgi:5-methyltetrahydropteroyltriglutamate--homocysteine methyltransferase